MSRTIICVNCNLSIALTDSVSYASDVNVDPFFHHNPECPRCGEYMRGTAQPQISLQEMWDIIEDDFNIQSIN